MFSADQVKALRGLVTDHSVYDVLTVDEMDVITNPNLIKDNIIVSKNQKSIIMKKVIAPAFDMYDTIRQILLYPRTKSP